MLTMMLRETMTRGVEETDEAIFRSAWPDPWTSADGEEILAVLDAQGLVALYEACAAGLPDEHECTDPAMLRAIDVTAFDPRRWQLAIRTWEDTEEALTAAGYDAETLAAVQVTHGGIYALLTTYPRPISL
jgi:hypothetical protein